MRAFVKGGWVSNINGITQDMLGFYSLGVLYGPLRNDKWAQDPYYETTGVYNVLLWLWKA